MQGCHRPMLRSAPACSLCVAMRTVRGDEEVGDARTVPYLGTPSTNKGASAAARNGWQAGSRGEETDDGGKEELKCSTMI